MPYIEVAEFTFVTDFPSLNAVVPSWKPTDVEAECIATEIADKVDLMLAERLGGDGLVAVRVEYELACVITSIGVGKWIAAGGLGAFVIQYPRIRRGLFLLAKDIRTGFTSAAASAKRLRTWLKDTNVQDSDKIRDSADDSSSQADGPVQPVRRTRRKTKEGMNK